MMLFNAKEGQWLAELPDSRAIERLVTFKRRSPDSQSVSQSQPQKEGTQGKSTRCLQLVVQLAH